MNEKWIAQRAREIEMSGVRRVFALARSLSNPIDLSIGQPHFEVAQPIRDAACEAIHSRKNGYTVSQGIAELREKVLNQVAHAYPGQSRDALVTSGTSGALLLALLATVNPGDEVILFDPYFVGYPAMVRLVGGTPVLVDTYPSFCIDPDRVRAAMTPRTRMILINTPANPTGCVLDRETVKAIAEMARERDVLIVSDEIYHAFCYDQPFVSPAEFNPDVLVVDGLGKTYGVTGWRLGYAHGPAPIIEQMIKLQQFTFVCAPSALQHAAVTAWDLDPGPYVAMYRKKRDQLIAALAPDYEFQNSGGAFYLFPRVPHGTATEFFQEAVKHQLLIIPGATFSTRDTHFRISYAVEDTTLERGIEVFQKLARR